ncbi:DNA polymerase III, delta subunit [Rhizobium sp. RU20A]|uniref:DNA polymerase III subunit delta n=1 Tax=Rhizobium sp. RU20A TaxID=1907412 RepID=UPI00095409D1|nr:DNA polymerase III subunit delta [Rhizobium sp. RU20A]SIQ84853.1 DNA polymerase III, delta subunit [Rhizobium sp. RU20A]
MPEIKSHEFERSLNRFGSEVIGAILYGPDRGLVSERAEELARASGVDLKDTFSLVRLEGSQIASDAGRLIDESRSIGLFGGKRLIWIRHAMNERGLCDALQVIDKECPTNCVLIIEAGDLKKGSALRKVGEAARAFIQIPCYADDMKTLSQLIDSELKVAGLTLSGPARERLQSALGGDRRASRNELRKLALYCAGRRQIEEEDVAAIVSDASSSTAEDAVDAMLSGDIDGLSSSFSRIAASKTPVFLVLHACLRQIQLLDAMRADMETNGRSVGDAMASHGRHLHFRRKPLVESALRRWTGAATQRDLTRLQNAIFQTRSQSSLEDSIAFHTLLAITVQAQRAGR